MSYFNNINNISLYKNNFNNIIDVYIFINSFINNSSKECNLFNNKILNKIFFKKNKKLRELLYKNHIIYNKKKLFFCENIIINDDECIYPNNIKNFNKKYLIKYFNKLT
jgi:hypothetical protein